MTKAQRLALFSSAALLILLGLVAAFLLGSSTGGGSGAGSSGGPSTLPSGGSSGPAPSGGSTSTQPMVVQSIEYSNGPNNGGGWASGFTLVFRGPTAPRIRVDSPGPAAGRYSLSFDHPVTLDPAILTGTGSDAARFLFKLRWQPGAQVLQVDVIGFASRISSTRTGTDVNRAGFDVIRTPTPVTSHDCLSITDPSPFTALYGLYTVKGTANVFEGGPFDLIVRAPGFGQTNAKVKTVAGPVNWSKQVSLPLLDHPAEGQVVAFDHSAKDGSIICLVNVPVWLSPGG
jgi:hypothetical protein